MQTKDFATQTNFITRENESVPGMWPIALDIGYSGVKGMSPNSVYSFPSFARKISGRMLGVGEPNPYDIQYRDEEAAWNVGECAQASLTADDTNDSLETLFGRNRYFAPMFLVIARTGLALGMMSNSVANPNGKRLSLQTGLPPVYLEEGQDAKFLRDALSGRHVFEVRVGNSGWKKFDFELAPDDIRIMSQPQGSLLSAAMDNHCRQLPEANSLFTSRVLIFDAGFNTLDIFSCRHRQIDKPQTFDNLGMKEVLARTSARIQKKFGTSVPVHTMQNNLKTGKVRVFNYQNMTTKSEDFTSILEECSREVCLEAIEKLKTIYNNLVDYDYLLVTGGTGAAWQEQITDYFKGMEDLKIIGGNANDTLPHIFSNVRGYYLYQIGVLRRRAKAEAGGGN